MKTNNTPVEIWQEIIKSKNPICTIDSRFDCDAFGSTLTLRKILKEQYSIDLRLTYVDTIPAYALKEALFYFKKVEQALDPKKIDYSKHDLLIVMDSGSEYHTSMDLEYKLPADIKKINIDHHDTNESYGDLNFVDATAVSTCSILFRILKENNIPIDQECAQMLLSGQYTDSGFFQFEKVTSDEFRITAELTDLGASVYKLSQKLFNNESIHSIKFKELVFSKVVVEGDYAYSTYLQQDLVDRGIVRGEVPTKAVDLIKRIAGTKFVFVTSQDSRGVFGTSFRAHEAGYDVSKFAKALGGGGHLAAASCDLVEAKTLEEALSMTIEVIKSLA